MSSFPPEVRNLVEHFARNRDALRSPAYNEAQARQEFIDPFFKALGWDMDNEQGLAEAYKDVIHEDAIKIGGATKAPDYCFRIGGTRKFFVEAKKPAVGLETDPEPAYQLRRYAWTSKRPCRSSARLTSSFWRVEGLCGRLHRRYTESKLV